VTSAGPPIITCALSRAITDKCEGSSRPAGKPTTAPSAAKVTGLLPSASVMMAKRGALKTGSPTIRMLS